MEAAGVEPAPPRNTNWLMVRDFSSDLAGNSLPCGQLVVLWSALESSGGYGDFMMVSRARLVSNLTAIAGENMTSGVATRDSGRVANREGASGLQWIAVAAFPSRRRSQKPYFQTNASAPPDDFRKRRSE